MIYWLEEKDIITNIPIDRLVKLAEIYNSSAIDAFVLLGIFE